MVGGRVIETKEVDNKVWINTREYIGENRDNPTSNTCAIYVERSPKSRSVSEGDIVWWQGGRAYWTPKDSTGKTIGNGDIVLNRIGFSGVSRPE